jgi:invasion protein IalB
MFVKGRSIGVSLVLLSLVWGGAWSANAANAADVATNAPLWARQCSKGPDGEIDICVVQQFVNAMPQNKPLLLAQFSYLGPQNKPRLFLVTPLGARLPAGLTLSVDGHKPITAPFEICDNGGCRSIIDMDTPALDQFRNGKVLTVRYAFGEHPPLDLPIKLDGLTKALKTIAP